jgi:Isochorismatase family
MRTSRQVRAGPAAEVAPPELAAERQSEHFETDCEVRPEQAPQQSSINPRFSENVMTTNTYTAEYTALLIVDPYNDFMSEGGKLYTAIKETADASGMFANLRKLIPAVRSAGIGVFIVAHHRSDPHGRDYDNW